MHTPPRARKRDFLTGRMFFLIQLLICCYAVIGVYRFGRSKSGVRLWKRLTRSPEEVSARLERRAALAEMDAAYKDTAVITLATGDAAAKHAVVLLQALRDTDTVIPRLIVLLSRGGMGSEDCHNETLRDRRNRHYHCSSKHVVADDIVSQIYLDAFSRLGAEVRIIDEIPNTKYTSMIPGGRATFWGMSFNKLRIFDMVEFKKVLFIDADVLILKNIDWVMLEPDFTAAFTTECCNGGARGKLGGGMGSEDCHNETLRDRRSRHYHCSSRHAVADDIVSQIYLDAFSRLGAEVRIIDEIPNTKYTSMIPGGRATFWGMSFNKLRIFDMVEFKKVLFIDADVLILKNIDWVMLEPDFTAAFPPACCTGGARGKLGGGMWVFEPSHARWNYTQALINTPCPDAEFGVRWPRRRRRAPARAPARA